MNEREVMRAAVMGQVALGEWTLVEAAERMELSYRQSKRLWARYRGGGAVALVHGSAGRVSNRAKPKKLQRKALRLIREKYSGAPGERFGPTLAAEHLLSEDSMELSPATVRRWMLEAGLWSRERKVREHRSRRVRRQHFGELVQMDGSFHDWLEGRGPRGCLMNLVDDATGVTLCRMGEQETIWSAVGVLRAWMAHYGVPRALYTDWKNVYVRPATPKELLQGKPGLTQFGRMCERLGIRIIAASSPQAKGRVERNHGTHQDRLVKKLRRKKIATHEAANEYLGQSYCQDHNRRFAVEPASEADYHLPTPGVRKLREILRLESERVLGNDWVVRHHNRFYQVERQSRMHAPAKGTVVICEWGDGTMEIHYRGQKLNWHEIAAPLEPRTQPAPAALAGRKANGDAAPPRGKNPNHPWRQGYDGIRPRRPQFAATMSEASSFAPP
jgi:hypothetical protein